MPAERFGDWQKRILFFYFSSCNRDQMGPAVSADVRTFSVETSISSSVSKASFGRPPTPHFAKLLRTIRLAAKKRLRQVPEGASPSYSAR